MLLCNAEDQLATSKTQIVVLKKKLEEAEKAKVQVEKVRDQAEQDGYGVRVVKPRKPSGLRSWGYVGLTAPRRGMKPSTRLGLRLYLRLGGQRTFTIPLPFVDLFPHFRGLMPSSRWQR